MAEVKYIQFGYIFLCFMNSKAISSSVMTTALHAAGIKEHK